MIMFAFLVAKVLTQCFNAMTSRTPNVQHGLHSALAALAGTSTEGTPFYELSDIYFANKIGDEKESLLRIH